MKRTCVFLLSLLLLMGLSTGISAQEVDKKKKKENPFDKQYQEYSRQKDSTQQAEFERLDKELEAYYQNERDWLQQTLGVDRDEIPAKATGRSLKGLEDKKASDYSIEKRDEGEMARTKYEENNAEKLVPSICPVKGKYRISSKFGWRTHPIHKKKQFHSGIDLAAPKGTPVLATADGIIVFAGKNGGYGKFVIIKHSDGMKTAYAHLSKILVSKGDAVTKNQEIAKVGSTGRSTGAHLHYEVIINNKKTDPAAYFQGD